MATALENWHRGVTSVGRSESLKITKVIPFKEHTTSNALVLALAPLGAKHFKAPGITVSANTVQLLAIQLALGWNKQSKYSYISASKLEENLGISAKTRKSATKALRELGFFGVVEGYINTNTDEAFTNCYYPLFDTKSKNEFLKRIQSDRDKWEATQPVEDSALPPNVEEGTADNTPF